MLKRVCIQGQSTTASDPSLDTLFAKGGRSVRPFKTLATNTDARSLRPIAIGQRGIPLSTILLRGRLIRLSYTLLTMQLTANGSSFSSPSTVDSSGAGRGRAPRASPFSLSVFRLFTRLSTIPSVTLAQPRRVTTDQEKRE